MGSYRHQVFRQLRYGHLPAFLALQREKNELYAAGGLTPYRMWAPAFGGLHHMVLEAEFDSMADFEKQHLAAKAIGRVGEINAAQLEHVIEGSASDALARIALEA
ncbi:MULTISPECIES: hypothetical protein [unclassified Pseudofrankia]|uniref:hypothetical protein n=1 Tax=unclassified Pseudofrankia TaxID=2994372 RepID=UPI0008D9F934|nr:MULTISPECIES: hypothetical protein [unclassified Pseudofrankia]MDT3438206.1 hypothetical protein [Pseudofrankia sp. BMG5.37]OHV46702.1 hypothetical protein BCD48_20700 [Pseudofrankia sp. BMG5.36]